jgi:uncharacterized protein (TIGR03435 family)
MFVGLLAATQSGLAQSHPQVSAQHETVAEDTKSFEVASLRPSPPGTPFGSNYPLSGPGDWKSDYLRADAIFTVYMFFAYDITDPVQGRAVWDKLPDWAKVDFFHIEARPEEVSTRDQMRLMMQSLLADRFKLRIHRETQVREAFLLTLKKTGEFGPQLRAHPADQQCVTDPSRPPVIPKPSAEDGAPRYCGMVEWYLDNGQQHIQIVDATMPEIANYLSSASIRGGAVHSPHAGTDATGLNGRYDLDLQFTPIPDTSEPVGGPTFMAALQKQAGLTLAEQKIPMQLIVLDQVERPAPN